MRTALQCESSGTLQDHGYCMHGLSRSGNYKHFSVALDCLRLRRTVLFTVGERELPVRACLFNLHSTFQGYKTGTLRGVADNG